MANDSGRTPSNICSAKPVDVKPVSRDAVAPDMVERVARALSGQQYGSDGAWREFIERASLALEASHHAELAEVLWHARVIVAVRAPEGSHAHLILQRIDAVLAKIGGAS